MKSRISWRSALVGGVVAALVVTALPVVAAVGDPILAGKTTTANAVTHLKGKVAAVNLKVTNTHAAGSAAKFIVEPGNAPFEVSSSAKVPKLNADKIDGVHAGGLMKKKDYDADRDGVVDTAQVAVRYAATHFQTDVGALWDDKAVCVTSSMTFDQATTVVGSGGMSLQPLGTDTTVVYAYLGVSSDQATWFTIGGVGVESTPNDGTGDASMPIDAAGSLAAGTWYFALMPSGGNDFVAGGPDYDGWCELTVTAYTGLGADIDGVTAAPTSLEELQQQKD